MTCKRKTMRKKEIKRIIILRKKDIEILKLLKYIINLHLITLKWCRVNWRRLLRRGIKKRKNGVSDVIKIYKKRKDVDPACGSGALIKWRTYYGYKKNHAKSNNHRQIPK